MLVVDRNSVRFLSAACKMSEVTEEGVTLVENLELKRQPMASMDAIYFISPTVTVLLPLLLPADFVGITLAAFIGSVHG